MDWDQYFMSMAYMVAMKSKDESTKVGTVIVDNENEILATGYNNFPRGFNDTLPERQQKPLKLRIMVHSELNACLSAARKGTRLHGSRLYCTWACCEQCALAIVQSGVTEVITHKDNPVPSSWADSIKFAQETLHEGGVTYREWSGDIIIPHMFTGGKAHQFPLATK
jgi:dCMP deaminase